MREDVVVTHESQALWTFNVRDGSVARVNTFRWTIKHSIQLPSTSVYVASLVVKNSLSYARLPSAISL